MEMLTTDNEKVLRRTHSTTDHRNWFVEYISAGVEPMHGQGFIRLRFEGKSSWLWECREFRYVGIQISRPQI